MKLFQISIFFIVILVSCNNNKTLNNNLHFDRHTGILEIENPTATSNNIESIIENSNIKKKGYGILLNIEKAVSTKMLKSIIASFRKKDINAVHIFNIEKNSITKKTITAIEGAGFIWLFYKDGEIKPVCQLVKNPLKKAIDNGGIIIIDKQSGKYYKECISE